MIKKIRYKKLKGTNVKYSILAKVLCYLTASGLFGALSNPLLADELNVGKVCPVTQQQTVLGHLVLSTPWYHDGSGHAAYIARDNAIGVGIEIHFFSNKSGDVRHNNLAQCDQYRLLQVRFTNSKILPRQTKFAIDVPDSQPSPFYDDGLLEHGRGSHFTPVDNSDKPWLDRHSRASTVGLYDTPYLSDWFGIPGKDINVEFETCVVCEKTTQRDSVLSCGRWGFSRDYVNEMDGWAEPQATPLQCMIQPTTRFINTVNDSHQFDYQNIIDWDYK